MIQTLDHTFILVGFLELPENDSGDVIGTLPLQNGDPTCVLPVALARNLQVTVGIPPFCLPTMLGPPRHFLVHS